MSETNFCCVVREPQAANKRREKDAIVRTAAEKYLPLVCCTIMTFFRKTIVNQIIQCRSMHTLKRLKRPISVAPMVDITTPVSLYTLFPFFDLLSKQYSKFSLISNSWNYYT